MFLDKCALFKNSAHDIVMNNKNALQYMPVPEKVHLIFFGTTESVTLMTSKNVIKMTDSVIFTSFVVDSFWKRSQQKNL